MNSVSFFLYTWCVSHKYRCMAKYLKTQSLKATIILILLFTFVAQLGCNNPGSCPAGQLCTASSWDQQASQGIVLLWQWDGYRTAEGTHVTTLWPRHETDIPSLVSVYHWLQQVTCLSSLWRDRNVHATEDEAMSKDGCVEQGQVGTIMQPTMCGHVLFASFPASFSSRVQEPSWKSLILRV